MPCLSDFTYGMYDEVIEKPINPTNKGEITYEENY